MHERDDTSELLRRKLQTPESIDGLDGLRERIRHARPSRRSFEAFDASLVLSDEVLVYIVVSRLVLLCVTQRDRRHIGPSSNYFFRLRLLV